MKRFNLPRIPLCFSTFTVALLHFLTAVQWATHTCALILMWTQGNWKHFSFWQFYRRLLQKKRAKCVQERTQLCSLAEIWENTTRMKYEQQIWNNNSDVLFLCVAPSSHFKQGQCCWFAYELLCKQCCSWCRTNALHMKNAIKACERGFKIGSGAGCVIYGCWGENSRGSPARRTK